MIAGMSEDEMFITMASVIVGLGLWVKWLMPVLMVDASYRSGQLRAATTGAGFASVVALFVILKLWASHDVRDAPQYLFQYTAMGMLGCGFVAHIFAPLMGISHRQDVCERRNAAAMWAFCGIIPAFMLAYAGSNIGDGPSWIVVVFCAALSFAFLGAIWFAFEKLFHVSDTITVERDTAAGMRLGGLLLGMGFVAGRGAAGDWMGVENAVEDFVYVAGPALPIPLGAAVVEWLLRPTPRHALHNVVIYGALPGLAYAVAGLLYVVILKPW